MDNKVLIATVHIAKDGVSCDCVCPMRDIKPGDQVQIFLNNAPVVGEVTAIKELLINELPNSVFDMKQVIRKVKSAVSIQAKANIALSLPDLVNRNMNVTVIGRGAMGTFLFSNDDIASFEAKVGKYIYFMDDEGTHFRSVILKIENSEETATTRLHMEAVADSRHLEELMQFQTEITNKKSTLKKCETQEIDLTIDECFTHIATRAFDATTTLQSLTISADLEIEPLAFSYNESIKKIRITNSRTRIALNCFDGCPSLKEVILPITLFWRRDELVAYYGDRIQFEFDLGSRFVLHKGVVYTKDFKGIVCAIDKEIQTYRSPIEVEYIFPYAFKDCRNLVEFTMSPFTKRVDLSILSGCMALRKVTTIGERDIDIVLLFGTEPIAGAKAETLQRNDGTARTFYLPTRCEFIRTPSPVAILQNAKPEKLVPEICHFIGDYYSSEHRPSEAIPFHRYAAMQGFDKSYQRLAEYAQIDSINQYFPVDLYDYAARLMTVKPLLRMLAVENKNIVLEDQPDSEIMKQYMNREALVSLLQAIQEADIFDLDLLQFGLDRIYRATKAIHDDEIKKRFLCCLDKVGLFEQVLPWRKELLDTVGADPMNIRLFAFDFVDICTFKRSEKAEKYIAALPASKEQEALQSAYTAAVHCDEDCVELFLRLLERSKQSGDDFYEKCAVLALEPYLSFCWNDKQLAAKFRSLLDLVLQKTQEGYKVVGLMALGFKRYLKKLAPKHFLFTCAEDLYNRGILDEGIFSDFLDTMKKQNDAKFYCRYPEYFNMTDKSTMVMRKLEHNWFCIPGSKIGDEKVKRGHIPTMYKEYSPELVEGKLILFLNEHEAVRYLQKHHLPVPNDFFYITLAKALSIMDRNGLSEATLFPRFYNKTITREYIDSTYDVD